LDLVPVSAGETFEHGSGDTNPVQAVRLEDLIAAGVRQEPGRQGERGGAGVGSRGGQRLSDPGA
jgi:hypothetical protein